MDVMSPELARAWSQYFRQKGGVGPSLPPDILPVVVIDDNSRGPYPPCRTWMGSSQAAQVAGVYGRIGIKNADGFPIGGGLLGTSGVPRSVVVVDELIVATNTPDPGGDLFLTITHHNLNDIDGIPAPADDTAPEKDPTPGVTRPQIGHIQIGPRITGAVLFGNTILPRHSDGVARHVDGPWILGPGQILYVERNLVNSGLAIYARGRYYSAP